MILTLRRGGDQDEKWDTTKNGAVSLSRHILCALSLRGMAERTAARFVNDELAQEIGSRHHPDN